LDAQMPQSPLPAAPPALHPQGVALSPQPVALPHPGPPVPHAGVAVGVPPAHVPPAHVPPAHVPPAHVPPAHVPPAHLGAARVPEPTLPPPSSGRPRRQGNPAVVIGVVLAVVATALLGAVLYAHFDERRGKHNASGGSGAFGGIGAGPDAASESGAPASQP